MTFMRGTRTVTAIALLLVAGCSAKGGSGNTSSSAAAADKQPSEPANSGDGEEQDNVAIPITTPSPTALTAMPATFEGRWGINAGDCDPARAAAAKGLMTITGNRVSFYESRGAAANLRRVAPAAITFDLPMSGEGQTWSEPTRLTLEGNGRSLVRQATGPADRAGVFTYQRCPA